MMGFLAVSALAVMLAAQTSFHKFRPPARAQQLAAIGSTKELPVTLQRAFDPSEGFQPLPKPDEIDWLANFEEKGQTFDQFVKSESRRPSARRKRIYLQPFGGSTEAAGVSLDALRRFTSAFFMMDVVVLPPLDLSRSPIKTRQNFYSHRPQMLTGDLLKVLYQHLPPDAFALMGITMTDLYPGPGWNYVFGQAAPRSAVGVYSFARYDSQFFGEAPTPASRLLLLRRACKILAHEAGHMFGIEHCIWFRCTMNGCNHLDELDGAPLHLCPVDERKLEWSASYDVLERYRRLRQFDRGAGLNDEADWIEQRLRFIEAGKPARDTP
jgi:archaemetzincin